jgi:hypothetical protein
MNTTPLRPRGARQEVCRRWVAPLTPLLALALSACVFSPPGSGVAEFAPAHSPHGVALDFARGSSELLAVRDDGLLVLFGGSNTPGRVVLVTWAAMGEAPVSGLGARWRPGEDPGPDARVRLAHRSRYSRGLSDEQLRELLGFHGQGELPRFQGQGELPRTPEGEGGDEAASHAHHPFHESVVTGTSEGEAAALAAFLAEAEEAARALGTPAEALLAGYRPLGPDFPGMGVHWIHPARMLRSGVDPARPPLLTFLDTPTGPLLTGVAFGAYLGPDEAPPPLDFPVRWHDHTGTIEEETLKLGPAAHGGHAGGHGEDAAAHSGHTTAHEERATVHDAGQSRMAMMHAWVGLSNPDGILAQDNWAVPFVRVGLAVPEAPTPEAGKALHLVAGGDAYYLGLFQRAAPLSPGEIARLEHLLERHREEVEALTAPIRASGGPSDPLVGPLAAIWTSLEREAIGAVEPGNRGALGVLFGRDVPAFHTEVPLSAIGPGA